MTPEQTASTNGPRAVLLGGAGRPDGPTAHEKRKAEAQERAGRYVNDDEIDPGTARQIAEDSLYLWGALDATEEQNRQQAAVIRAQGERVKKAEARAANERAWRLHYDEVFPEAQGRAENAVALYADMRQEVARLKVRCAELLAAGKSWRSHCVRLTGRLAAVEQTAAGRAAENVELAYERGFADAGFCARQWEAARNTERTRAENAERQITVYARAFRLLREMLGLPDESPDDGRDALGRIGELRRAERERDEARARVEALRLALTDLKRHCYHHAGGDNSCTCPEIDAALASAPPDAEQGRREKERAVVEAASAWFYATPEPEAAALINLHYAVMEMDHPDEPAAAVDALTGAGEGEG